MMLGDHRVDCWAVALEPLAGGAEEIAIKLLSAEERQRAERFRFERNRRMYVNTHAALRLLLARYLHASPAALVIVPDPNGRPVLAGSTELHFNLSHSGALALIAISSLGPLGIDIEEVRDVPDYVDIARRYFARTEVDRLLQLPATERLGGFFVTWTRKEAYVKALGLGLSVPLNFFSTGRPDAAPMLIHPGGAVDPNWTMADLACADTYRAALAVRHRNVKVDCREAPWSWLLDGVIARL
jgi:4'-phosphopantetheinyl transferase